jgi:hypothetical protein
VGAAGAIVAFRTRRNTRALASDTTQLPGVDEATLLHLAARGRPYGLTAAEVAVADRAGWALARMARWRVGVELGDPALGRDL